MKKAALDYAKSIWFKLTKSEMARIEAVLLFGIILALSYLITHIINVPIG